MKSFGVVLYELKKSTPFVDWRPCGTIKNPTGFAVCIFLPWHFFFGGKNHFFFLVNGAQWSELPFWAGLCEQVAKKVLTEEVSPILLAMVEPPCLSWNLLCVFCVFFPGREWEDIILTYFLCSPLFGEDSHFD